VGDSDGTSSVKANSKKIWVVSNVRRSDQTDIAWRASLEASWDKMSDPFGSNGAADMCNLWKSIFVEADAWECTGQKCKQSIRELRYRSRKRIRWIRRLADGEEGRLEAATGHIPGEAVNGVLGFHKEAIVSGDIGAVIIPPGFKGGMFGNSLSEVKSRRMAR
jgi:hypothetical protein